MALVYKVVNRIMIWRILYVHIGVYGNQSEIVLDWNNIRRFESGVFKSLLEQMAPFGGYNSPPGSFTFISMYQSNKLIMDSDTSNLYK